MSVANTQAARIILDNLLKSKKELKDLRLEIGGLNSDLSRMTRTVMGLARGDPTSLIVQLAQMGPYGVAAAIAIGIGVAGYGIYRQATKEQPTEMYFWRYPE